MTLPGASSAPASMLRVLIPYFGNWPPWMAFFLRSCAENPGISWFLFSDCGVPERCPPNVQVVEIGFDDYCKLVSSRLDIEFTPESSRKLCDIKPALAAIHPEYLEQSPFWAFGDIDVLYGDLEAYLRLRSFEKHDVTSLHLRRISGHLTVLRNDVDMNAAFRRVPNWQASLSAPRHTAFDEKAFTRVFLRHKNSPRWVHWLARKHDPWLSRADFQEAYTTPCAKIPWIDGSLDFPTSWLWRRGRLSNDKDGSRCFPYIHFMHWKKKWQPADVRGVEHAWDPSLTVEIRESGIVALPSGD
ncbi:DUF6625 family protein [Rhodocyclaceae bacterium SMB388]